VIFKRDRFQFPDSYQAIKLAMFYQFGIECIGNINVIPVVGGIVVANQNFYFISGKIAVMDPILVLLVTEIVFIFPLG
jgi:hypothetical protein